MRRTILITLGMLVIALIVGTVIWLQFNRDQLRSAYAKGQTIGATQGGQVCMDLTIEESKLCSVLNVSCLTEAQLSLSGCMQSAPDAKIFCVPVPEADDPTAESWIEQACRLRAHGSDSCTSLMHKLLSECDKIRIIENVGINTSDP
jgi:hypothetical protein